MTIDTSFIASLAKPGKNRKRQQVSWRKAVSTAMLIALGVLAGASPPGVISSQDGEQLAILVPDSGSGNALMLAVPVKSGKIPMEWRDPSIKSGNYSKYEVAPERALVKVSLAPGKDRPTPLPVAAQIPKLGAGMKLITLRQQTVTETNVQISGVGLWNLAVSPFETEGIDAGCMLNADGELAAILVRKAREINVNRDAGFPVIELAPERWDIVRTDKLPTMIELSLADISKQSENLAESETFLRNFLPVMNFWLENPYRSCDFAESLPSGMEAWVKKHNDKAGRYSVFIADISEDMLGKQSLAKSLQQSIRDRTMRLSKFSSSQALAMRSSKWSSPALASYARSRAEIFERITAILERRAEMFLYHMPNSF